MKDFQELSDYELFPNIFAPEILAKTENLPIFTTINYQLKNEKLKWDVVLYSASDAKQTYSHVSVDFVISLLTRFMFNIIKFP